MNSDEGSQLLNGFPDFISILFPLVVSTPKMPNLFTSLISNGYKFTNGHAHLIQNLDVKSWRDS